MGRPLTIVAIVGLAALTAAAEPQPVPDDPKPIPALAVGDPAPSLQECKWLQGGEVKAFEPGQIYVVEFWAAWCDARIRHLPRFADIQTRYGKKGVTVVAVTSRNIRGVTGNTEDEVAAFVKKHGPQLDIRFAYALDETTTDAWLEGRDYFMTFIVDRRGQIAYAGSPLFVDLALVKVLAGDASVQQIGAEMEQVEAEYHAVDAAFERSLEAGVDALNAFDEKYPPLADSLPAASIKLHQLLTQGKGKEYAQALVQNAGARKNRVLLELVCRHLIRQKENKDCATLAVRSAKAIVQIDGGKNPHSLLLAAEAHQVNGDSTAASELARKALEIAQDEPADVQESIRQEAKRFGIEK